MMGANKTSTCKGGCCAFATHNDGDYWVFNGVPTKENPIEMVAGKNPSAPPCLRGKKVLKMYEVADRKGTPVAPASGGAPANAAAMER